MANRAMAAKRIKMAKERRAWAKQFSRRGYMQPNREIIKEYKNHAQGLGLDEQVIDQMVIIIQKREGVSNPHVPKMDGEGRKAALKRQAELEAVLPNGCDQRIVGPSGRDCLQESWIYFNSQRNCFVLVHVDLTTCTERRSTTYSSLELLMMCWQGDAVRWMKK